MVEEVKQTISYDIDADASALVAALDQAQAKFKEQQESQKGFVSSLAGGLGTIARMSIAVVGAFQTLSYISSAINTSTDKVKDSVSGFGKISALAAEGAYGKDAQKIAPAMEKAYQAAQKMTRPLSSISKGFKNITRNTARFTSSLRGASDRIQDSAAGLNKMRQDAEGIPRSFSGFSESVKNIKDNYSAATASAKKTRTEQEKTTAAMKSSSRFAKLFKDKLSAAKGVSGILAHSLLGVSKHAKAGATISQKLNAVLSGTVRSVYKTFSIQERLNNAFRKGVDHTAESLRNAKLHSKAWSAVKGRVSAAKTSLGGFSGVLGKIAGTTFGKLLIGVALVGGAFKSLQATVGSIKVNQKLAESLGISEVDTKRLSNSFKVIDRDLKKTISALDEARKQSRSLNATNLTATIGEETTARLRNARDSSEALRIATQRINESSTESERRIVTQLLLGQQLTESQVESLQRLNDSQRTWGLSAEQIEGNSEAITRLTVNWNEFKQSISANVFDKIKTLVFVPVLDATGKSLGALNRGFELVGQHWKKFTNFASGGSYAIPETLADTAKAAAVAAGEISSIPDAMKGAFDSLSGDLSKYKNALQDVKKEFSKFAPKEAVDDLSSLGQQYRALSGAMEEVNRAQTTDISAKSRLEIARETAKVYDNLAKVGFDSPQLKDLKKQIYDLATQAGASLEIKTRAVISFKAAQGNEELEKVAQAALDGIKNSDALKLRARIEVEQAELERRKEEVEQFWRDNPVKMKVVSDLPEGLSSRGGGFSDLVTLGAT